MHDKRSTASPAAAWRHERRRRRAVFPPGARAATGGKVPRPSIPPAGAEDSQRASLRRAVRRKSLISLISLGCERGEARGAEEGEEKGGSHFFQCEGRGGAAASAPHKRGMPRRGESKPRQCRAPRAPSKRGRGGRGRHSPQARGPAMAAAPLHNSRGAPLGFAPGSSVSQRAGRERTPRGKGESRRPRPAPFLPGNLSSRGVGKGRSCPRSRPLTPLLFWLRLG